MQMFTIGIAFNFFTFLRGQQNLSLTSRNSNLGRINKSLDNNGRVSPFTTSQKPISWHLCSTITATEHTAVKEQALAIY